MRDRKFKILVMAVVAVIAVTTLVMLLWNALLPVIFGIKSIGFFQALGLLILCKILFGGFGGRGMFGHRGQELRERWMAMSPRGTRGLLSNSAAPVIGTDTGMDAAIIRIGTMNRAPTITARRND